MRFPTDRERVKWLYLEAMRFADARDREEFLNRECAGDARLLPEVQELIEARTDGEEFFARDPLEQVLGIDPGRSPLTTAGALGESTGSVIDRYRLVEPIGEGGFAVVFRAEQREPVVRDVALKILKPGMDTRQVVTRFEAERQALALMDHPHIAKVFDGGTTPQGRPYFVMELVQGLPVTRYCDQHRLDLRRRLELFQQICAALQHAHLKGIIHRDIKPSNVLVTRQDDRPVPKVIDFGIAKATQESLTDKTLFTQAQLLLGTPAYMSPEQAASNGVDLDTRSDIYGLGVLLYELITGQTPLTGESLVQLGYEQMLRTIREVDPPKPSAVVRRNRRQRPGGEATRGEENAPVSRELDWIVMKALEKDRDRRYESAIDLSRDIGRFLNHEPITAFAPTTSYLVRKLVRRHRGALLAGSAIVLSLAAGTVISLREAARARRQAEVAEGKTREAQDILRFFEQKILAAPRPALSVSGGLGMDTTLREAIAAAEPDIAEMFRSRPAVQASIRYTLGETYRMLNDPKVAIAQFEAALRLRREHLGAEHPDTLQTMEEYASALKDVSRNEEATQLLSDLLAARVRVLGPVHPVTVRSMFALAWQHAHDGHGEEAFALYRETLETCQRAWGAEHRTTLDAMKCLARTGYQTGREEQARRWREEVLAVRTRLFGPDDPDTILAKLELAQSYDAPGPQERAVGLREEAFESCRRVLGDDHLYTRMAVQALAECYHRLGRAREAALLYDSEVVLLRRVYGVEHASTLHAMGLLAGFQSECGRLEEAQALRQQILETQRRVLGPDHPDTVVAERSLHSVSASR